MPKILRKLFTGGVVEGKTTCEDIIHGLESQTGCRIIVYNPKDDGVEYGAELIEELDANDGILPECG